MAYGLASNFEVPICVDIMHWRHPFNDFTFIVISTVSIDQNNQAKIQCSINRISGLPFLQANLCTRKGALSFLIYSDNPVSMILVRFISCINIRCIVACFHQQSDKFYHISLWHIKRHWAPFLLKSFDKQNLKEMKKEN